MGELVIKEDPGKAFEKGKIEVEYVGPYARGHSGSGDCLGTKE